ncbi:hypothetical protein WME89_41790 [Sorangium sp. So ce321]|uniref:hypothetical protein n=1 Tax=Sorangium sp. So ce321 TaxID=3133300 RepID=UPI003F6066B7
MSHRALSLLIAAGVTVTGLLACSSPEEGAPPSLSSSSASSGSGSGPDPVPTTSPPDEDPPDEDPPDEDPPDEDPPDEDPPDEDPPDEDPPDEDPPDEDPPDEDPPDEDPPFGVDAPVSGPALGNQDMPAAAFNGDEYLVVWADSRPVNAYAARVSPEGAVLDDVAFPLPLENIHLDVASDGDGFLVVGRGARPTPAGASPGLVAARVSGEGHLLGTSLITAATPDKVKVASSGSEYLVLWEEWGSTASAPRSLRFARVALDGAVLDPGGVLLDDQLSLLANVAFDGTSYVIAWSSAKTDSGQVMTIDPGGAVLEEASLPIYPDDMDCQAGRCLVAWGAFECPPEMGDECDPMWDGAYRIRATWMTPRGELLDPAGALLGSPWANDGRIAVGFDGANGAVAWSAGQVECSEDEVRFAYLSPDGAAVHPGGLVLQGSAGDPAVASAQGQLFIAWTDERLGTCSSSASIYGARIAPEADVLDPDGGVLVSRSANAQLHPAVAFDGEGFAVTWSDDRNAGLSMREDIYLNRVDAAGLPVAPAATQIGAGAAKQVFPRVSFDGTDALLAWWDCSYPNFLEVECAVGGARVGASGATPQVFPFFTWTNPRLPPALSSGGGQTLVGAYRDMNGLGLAAFGADYTSASVYPEYDFSSRIASASDGVNHLFVWVEDPRYGGPLFGARVAPDGTVLDPDGFPITPPDARVLTFSLAYGAGEYLVAWHDATTGASRILTTRVSPDGATLDEAPTVIAEHPECLAPWRNDSWTQVARVNLGSAAVAFDGQRFVLGWKACGPASEDVYGALVGADGALLTRFPVTADAHLDDPPALAGTGDGTALIAYPSFRAEPPFGTWRVVTHHVDGTALLDATPAPSE